jgi:hypothetical protein
MTPVCTRRVPCSLWIMRPGESVSGQGVRDDGEQICDPPAGPEGLAQPSGQLRQLVVHGRRLLGSAVQLVRPAQLHI